MQVRSGSLCCGVGGKLTLFRRLHGWIRVFEAVIPGLLQERLYTSLGNIDCRRNRWNCLLDGMLPARYVALLRTASRANPGHPQMLSSRGYN